MSIPYLPLEHWKRKWAVQNGVVRCRKCNATLEECQVRRPFRHGLRCRALRSPTHYPLRELMILLFEQDQLDRQPGEFSERRRDWRKD